MKKIGIYAEHKREAYLFIFNELGDDIKFIDFDKKYIYMNPLDKNECSLEKLKGSDISKIYFASEKIQMIYEFFSYANSRVR